MKSSTLIRSMLSKENMDMIENLSEENNTPTEVKESVNQSIEEYVRPESEKSDSILSKAQEIDLLWQNFKTAQFSNQSPAVYVTMGFIGGIISTLIVGGIFGYFISKPDVKLSMPNFSSIFASKAAAPVSDVEEQDQSQEVSARVVVPDESGEAQVAQSVTETETEKVEQSPVQASSGNKKHVVSDGETVEGIIKHYYGSYSPERAEKIKQVNNLKSLDRISIGQELIIPQEGVNE